MLSKNYFCFASLLFFLNLCNGLHLPDYLKPCSLSDPALSKCLTDNGNQALPTLIKGDKKYNIRSFLPLSAPEMHLDAGNALKILVKNVTINGFETMKVTKFNIESDNKIYHGLLETAGNLFFNGIYDMNGQILILPILGHGVMNSTLIGGDFQYFMDFESKSRDGVNYFEITKSNLDFTVQRGYLHFENLFNGDEVVGKQLNKFIDENWKDILEEMKPSIKAIMKAIVEDVFQSLFKKIPAENFFLP